MGNFSKCNAKIAHGNQNNVEIWCTKYLPAGFQCYLMQYIPDTRGNVGTKFFIAYIIRFVFSVKTPETLHSKRVVCISDLRVDVQRLGHFRIVGCGNCVPNFTTIRANTDNVIGWYDTKINCNSLPHFRWL